MSLGRSIKVGAGLTLGGCGMLVLILAGLSFLGERSFANDRQLKEARGKLQSGMTYQQANALMGGVKSVTPPTPDRPNITVVRYKNGVIAAFNGDTLLSVFDPDKPR